MRRSGRNTVRIDYLKLNRGIGQAEVSREIDQNAYKNINVNMTLEESLMNDSQESIAPNQQAAKLPNENDNDSIAYENRDYIEFKQHVADQLFIIKETMHQKLEALSLNQQLEHLSTNSDMVKMTNLEVQVKELQRENQSIKSDLSAMEVVNNQQKNELNADNCKVKLLEYEI